MMFAATSAIFAGGLEVDLAEDDVDHAVQELLLVPHVVVERHRLDPHLLSQVAHAQRLDALAVGQGNGGPEDSLPAQLGSRHCSSLTGLIAREDRLAPKPQNLS